MNLPLPIFPPLTWYEGPVTVAGCRAHVAWPLCSQPQLLWSGATAVHSQALDWTADLKEVKRTVAQLAGGLPDLVVSRKGLTRVQMLSVRG